MYKSLCCFLVLISALIFVSCSDDPTSTGLGLINGNDKYNFIEVSTDTVIQSSSYIQEDVELVGASRLLLGKYRNVQASILTRFNLTSLQDSIREQILVDSINVSNAWIKFSTDYYIGNENAAFDYNVNIVNNYWTTGYNSDSLALLNLGAEISSGRTVNSFTVSNSAALNWLVSESDTDAVEDYGIYISPTSAEKIVGYYSSGTSDSRPSPQLYIVIEKPGSYIDTLVYQSLTKVHVVQGTVPDPIQGRMFVQGGLAIHSKWKFDITGIPQKSSINSAVIELFWDSTSSYRGVPPTDSLVVKFDSAATTFDSSVALILKRDGEKFTGDIYYFLQQWVNAPGTNRGLIFSLPPSRNEMNTVDFISLFDTKAVDPAKRPKLKIIYSTNLK